MSSSLSTPDVYKELLLPNSKMTCGPDGFSTVVLKKCAVPLSPMLTESFNKCLWKRNFRFVQDACHNPSPRKVFSNFRLNACTLEVLNIFIKLIFPCLVFLLKVSGHYKFACRFSSSTFEAHFTLACISLALDKKSKTVRIYLLIYCGF